MSINRSSSKVMSGKSMLVLLRRREMTLKLNIFRGSHAGQKYVVVSV